MFKVTPNPPDADPVTPYECPGSKKLHDAAERALDYHLGPAQSHNHVDGLAHIRAAAYRPNRLYQAHPESDNESLLADASETLGSATVMLNELVGQLDGSRRKTLQGMAQVVMVAEMAVNRVLDKVVPTE